MSTSGSALHAAAASYPVAQDSPGRGLAFRGTRESPGQRSRLAAPARRLAMRLRARGALLLPKRALALARELPTRGVEAIKADS
jgi:hypothetical protein